MRAALLLLLAAVVGVSSFAAVPRVPVRHRRAVAPPLTTQLSGAAAAEVPRPKWWGKVTAALSSFNDWKSELNLSGIEYLIFAGLVFWGSVCVAINYVLWIPRRALELSGLAPDSWDPGLEERQAKARAALANKKES